MLGLLEIIGGSVGGTDVEVGTRVGDGVRLGVAVAVGTSDGVSVGLGVAVGRGVELGVAIEGHFRVPRFTLPAVTPIALAISAGKALPVLSAGLPVLSTKLLWASLTK